jgi:hypothetical protein
VVELGQPYMECDGAGVPISEIDIPFTFQTLENAATVFELYYNATFRRMERPQWDRTGYTLPMVLEADKMKRRFFLQRWRAAFESYLRISDVEGRLTAGRDHPGVLTLQMYKIVLEICLLVDKGFDHFTAHFPTAVSYGTRLVEVLRNKQQPKHPPFISSKRDRRNEPPVYMQDPATTPIVSDANQSKSLGGASPFATILPKTIPEATSPLESFCNSVPREDLNNKLNYTLTALSPIPVLYLIAWRCRDYSIRRQAIQILRLCDQRDGLWGSGIAARVAERIVTLEEIKAISLAREKGTLMVVERAEQIPMEARFGQIQARFDDGPYLIVDFVYCPGHKGIPGPDCDIFDFGEPLHRGFVIGETIN